MTVTTELLGHGDTVATYSHWCSDCRETWCDNSAHEPKCPLCGAEEGE